MPALYDFAEVISGHYRLFFVAQSFYTSSVASGV